MNLITFYLTQSVKNIFILTCNQSKILAFTLVFKNWCVFYTYNIGLALFQVLHVASGYCTGQQSSRKYSISCT